MFLQQMNIGVDGARWVAIAPSQYGFIAFVGGKKAKDPPINWNIFGRGLKPTFLRIKRGESARFNLSIANVSRHRNERGGFLRDIHLSFDILQIKSVGQDLIGVGGDAGFVGTWSNGAIGQRNIEIPCGAFVRESANFSNSIQFALEIDLLEHARGG